MTNSNQQYSNVLPVGKFCFLYIITLGLYQIPWCHKQWKFLKEKDDLNINPWLYAWFFAFTIYSLAKKVFHLAEKEGYPNRPSAGGITALYWFFIVLSNLFFLFAFLSLIPLVSILKAVNYYWEQEEGGRLMIREGFTGGQVAWIVFGVLFWLLFLIGLFSQA
jgi:hypothetical protein